MFTIGNSYPWNSAGNGLMQQLIDIPIVQADTTEVSYLLELAEENSRNKYEKIKLHSIEFDFYMGKNNLTSINCLGWRDIDGVVDPKCTPIGGQSVWATLGTLDQRPKIILTAAFDTTAEFHDISFGVNEAVSSLAVVLIVAKHLSMLTDSSLDNQPLIFLSNADEWGFSGSRRFVRDLYSFNCSVPIDHNATSSGFPLCLSPLYPSTLFTSVSESDTKLIITLDQIGKIKSGKSVYLHHYSSNEDNEDIIDSISSIANSKDIELTIASSNSKGVLPPTPLTSFVREMNNIHPSAAINGIMFTGRNLSKNT